jgi:DNA modification methylase
VIIHGDCVAEMAKMPVASVDAVVCDPPYGLEGFNFVGIEREEEYVRIAEARIRWWGEHPEGVEMDKALKADRERRAVADSGQLGFLD